jgi:hypothetical protein
MPTHRSTTILLNGLLTLAIASCKPSAPDAAGGDAGGTGAGVPASAGVTATPMAQVAKFDYGTQHTASGGVLQWSNTAIGVPEATPEYACSAEHTVAVDSTAEFKAEQAGTCPDGKPFYRYTW